MADTQKNRKASNGVSQVGGVFAKKTVTGGTRMMLSHDDEDEVELVTDDDECIDELRAYIRLCLLM